MAFVENRNQGKTAKVATDLNAVTPKRAILLNMRFTNSFGSILRSFESWKQPQKRRLDLFETKLNIGVIPV